MEKYGFCRGFGSCRQKDSAEESTIFDGRPIEREASATVGDDARADAWRRTHFLPSVECASRVRSACGGLVEQFAGYFEDLSSDRAIGWKCADSLSLQEFLAYEPTGCRA